MSGSISPLPNFSAQTWQREQSPKRWRCDGTFRPELARTAGDILAAVSRAKQAERLALPPELVATRPDIPWRDIVDMRNFLSHEYFRVLADVVRQTIDEPLNQLRLACEQLLADRETGVN
jgi:hypothetical protein